MGHCQFQAWPLRGRHLPPWARDPPAVVDQPAGRSAGGAPAEPRHPHQAPCVSAAIEDPPAPPPAKYPRGPPAYLVRSRSGQLSPALILLSLITGLPWAAVWGKCIPGPDFTAHTL